MKALFGLLALAPLALSLHADTLQLRDGRVINGTFEGGDRAGIRFHPYGEDHARLFDFGTVANITFEGNPATSTYNSSDWNNNGTADRMNGPYGAMPQATSPMPPATSPMPAQTMAPANSYSNPPYNGPYTGPTYSSANIQSPQANVIPAGTVISVRTIDRIECDGNSAGSTYQVTLAQPIIVNGRMVAPAGSTATVEAMGVQHGDVSLQLVSFTDINGRVINVPSSDAVVAGGPHGRQSAEVIGGGAALGAIVGAVAGGGPGAAIGAATGAAAGAGYQLMRGHHIKIEPETLLAFTVQQNVAL